MYPKIGEKVTIEGEVAYIRGDKVWLLFGEKHSETNSALVVDVKKIHTEQEIPNENHSIETKLLVAGNLRRIRKEKALTQKELSAISGISTNTLIYIESGSRPCSLDTIDVLAKALTVSPSSFFENNLTERAK